MQTTMITRPITARTLLKKRVKTPFQKPTDA